MKTTNRKDLMFEFKHTLSLTPKWQKDFVDVLGCSLVGNTGMNFKKEIANGYSCFLEVSPEISVLLLDIELNKSIQFVRMPSEEDFWIVNYDLSDDFNKHIINEIPHKCGAKAEFSFAIIDNKIKSIFLCKEGQRVYSLRLFIRKSFFLNPIYGVKIKDFFEDNKKNNFFYGHIDSRSIVLLHHLKQRHLEDVNFELLLKSTTFNLLGYLLERLAIDNLKEKIIFEKDLNFVLKSQKYLLSDLLNPFPGINRLAKVANMSSSKYRVLYVTVFGTTPSLFFRNEKLILAKELLESGDFKLVSDVAYQLGFKKTSYFSLIYRKFHGKLPNQSLNGNAIEMDDKA